MPFRDDVRSRQLDSLIEKPSGETSRRVFIANDSSEPVITSGEVTFSGLSTALKITNTSVTDTTAKLPLVALTDRNSLIVENRSATDPIYIGNSDVTSTGATEGWIIEAGSFFTIDIRNSIELFAVADAGKTVTIKIMEMA